MEIFAWCIMTNHVPLVFRTKEGLKPEVVLGDFKRFTSRAVVKAIEENPRESRKDWMLDQFYAAGAKASNVKNYQFWQHHNKPIELWSNKVITQKVHYIHQNPVEAGLVAKAEDYLYSSAQDYAGGKGYLEGIILVDL